MQKGLILLCVALAGALASAGDKVAVAMLMGLGGETTSKGVVQMCDHVNKHINGTSCKYWHWDQWQDGGKWLQSFTGKRVILGYSNGGSKLTNVCQMGFPVDLALALDPTIWLPIVPLEGNVRRAVCFHDTNPLNPVGHAYLKKGKHFNGTLITIDTSDLHLNVDTDPKIQGRCFQEIEALVN